MKDKDINSESSGRLRIALVGSVPLILLGMASVALWTLWERIPERVAVHFGVHGPDRWLDRSTRVVYGPVIIGAEICAWLLMLAFVGWANMRRGRGRSFFAGLMLWLEYLLGSMFVLISLSPLVTAVSQFWVPLLLIAFWLMVGIVLIRRLQTRGGPLESTDDECWRGGLFYYNRNDPALLVEIREGNNFTLNFANPLSWGLLVGTVLMAVVIGVQINLFFR